MHTRTVQRTAYITSALLGMGLVFIGARFLLVPEVAEQGFGLRFDEGGNYAFHSIKGIRDLFSGLVIVMFALRGQREALTIVLGVGTIVPLTDMVIVLTNPNAIRSAAWIHGTTVVIMLLLVIILLNGSDSTQRVPPQPEHSPR